MWKIVFFLPVAVFAVGLGALVGGKQEIDVNDDEGAQNALNFAVVEHNRGSNSLFLSQPIEVIKVERQIVAGAKYFITVKMAMSTCRKDSANEVCGIQQVPKEARHYQCIFTVWSQPWRNHIEVKELC